MGSTSEGFTDGVSAVPADNKTEGSSLMGGKTFIPLLETQQETTRMTLDGKEVSVYDHPMSDSPWRVCNQGSAFPNGPTGTCGLCASGSTVNKAGGHTGEKEMTVWATQNGQCDSDGGSSPQNWVKILSEGAGIPAEIHERENLSDLATYVEEGRGVIIGVSARSYCKEWYGNYWIETWFNGKPDGHAITLDSVARDIETGKPIGYFVSDSNGSSTSDAGLFVPAAVLEKAFKRRGKQAVVTKEIIW